MNVLKITDKGGKIFDFPALIRDLYFKIKPENYL